MQYLLQFVAGHLLQDLASGSHVQVLPSSFQILLQPIQECKCISLVAEVGLHYIPWSFLFVPLNYSKI